MQTPAVAPTIRTFPRSLILVIVTCALAGNLVTYLSGGNSKLQIALQVCFYSFSVFALLLITVLRRRYTQELGWSFMLAAHAFWFAIPAFTQLLIPGHWYGDWIEFSVPNEALSKAVVLISLFFSMTCYTYLLIKNKNSSQMSFPTKNLFKVNLRVYLVSALFGIGLTPYIFFGSGLSNVISEILLGRAQKSWTESSEDFTTGDKMMTIFWLSRAFLVTAVTLSALYATESGKRRSLVKFYWVFLFLLGSLILFFDQGTRSYVVMALGPIGAFLAIRAAMKGRVFKPIKLIAVGLIIVFALITFTQLQVKYRMDYSREEIGGSSVGEILNPKHHADFFTETAVGVDLRDNHLRENFGEPQLYFFLVNPIPRVLWPEKPLPQTMWQYTLYRWNIDIFEKGGNALPSVVGQYYINGSYWAVMWVGLLYGLLFRLGDYVLFRGSQYIELFICVGSAFTFLLLSFRFLFPNFHYPVLLMVLITMVHWKLEKRRQSKLKLQRNVPASLQPMMRS